MASPAAVLNILIGADTAEASSKLTRFSGQLDKAAAQARKGIEARLGGQFDGVAFSKYEEATQRAAKRTADRKAFRAELGADFSPAGFRAYQKASEQTVSESRRTAVESERAGRGLKGFGSAAAGAGRSVHGLATGLLAAGGAFVAYEKAKAAIESTVELTAATIRLTAATGLDAKTASTWIEVMKVRGVQASAVSMGFITLEKNIRNAGEGSKAAKTAFQQFGIPLETIKRQNVQATILDIADAYAKSENPVQRAAIAQQLFGRNAKVLMPILAQGRQGIDEMLASAQRYGAFLPNNVKQFEQAHEAQLKLNLAMDGFKISFTQAVLPVLVMFAGKMTTFISQMREGKGAGGEFASVISQAFTFIKTTGTQVIAFFGGLKNTIRDVAVAFAAVKIAGFAQGILALGPAGLVLAGLAAAAVLIVKNWRTVGPFFKGMWDSIRSVAEPVIGWLIGAWGTMHKAALAVFPTVRAVAVGAFQAIGAAVLILKAAFDVAWAFIGPFVRAQIDLIVFAVTKALIPAFNAIKGPVSTAIGVVISVFKTMLGVIRTVINFILGLLSTFLHALGDVVSAASKIPLIGKVFRNAGNDISNAADKIDQLRNALNGVPTHKGVNVDVHVDFMSNVSGAIQSIARSVGAGFNAVTGNRPGPGGHFYSGGVVNTPSYVVGEEAPQHPEVIIATNPRYRQRNLGLFAQAGRMLGIPGFAFGGISNPGAMVSDVPPWTATHAADWIKGPAGSWVKGIVGRINAAQGPGSPGGPTGVGSYMGVRMANWVIAALRYAAAHGSGNPQPTSGYRPGFDPHTATGTSEHQGTQYPHGAVDFGGMVDPPAFPRKMAVVNATRGFRWRLLAPMGFRDDGHASGTGHRRGGIWPGRLQKALGFATGGIFTYGGLEGLWDAAGGNRAAAPLAAAVAMAESGGRVNATNVNSNGSIDRGLWQINSVHGALSTYSVAGNARAAVEISNNGRNWSPWTTYNSGAYRQFLRGNVPASGGAALPGPRVSVRVTGTGSGTRIVGGHIVGGHAKPGTPGAYPGSRRDHWAAGQPWLHGWQRYTQAQQKKQGNIVSRLMDSLAVAPSQTVLAQIYSAGMANRLTAAQNAGDIPGQGKALKTQLTAERGWLTADRGQLATINAWLSRKGLPKPIRDALLADKLNVTQAIGTDLGNIGSTTGSLSDIFVNSFANNGAASGGSSSAGGGVSTGDPNQPLIDAATAQTDAMNALKATLEQHVAAMTSVGMVEKQQAVKFMADIIGDQIGARYLSRSTGSAGDGSIARYGSVRRS